MNAARLPTLLLSTAARRTPALAAPARLPRCPTCSSSSAPRPSLVRLLNTAAPTRAPKRQASKGVLRDEDIPHRTVILVDPTTKALLPPSTVSSLLASLDRTRFSIQLADASADPPICRLVDKKAEYDKAREKKDKDKERAKQPNSVANQPPREVHFTWGVSAHDLEHKLKKGREFLEKGGRVQVHLADKKGTTVRPNQEVKQQVIRQVEQALEGIGALQGKPSVKHGQTILEFKPVGGAAKSG
ncbi:hypothetical protein JCM8097_006763 [Rhodosporidiobolus ruineniae]